MPGEEKPYQIPDHGPQQQDRSYTINGKYLATQVVQPRNIPIVQNALNVISAKEYGLNPNLVLSQVAAEGKYILQSRGLQVLKTAAFRTFANLDVAQAEELRKQQQDGKGALGLPMYDVIQFGGDTTDNILRYKTKQWDSKQQKFIEKSIEAAPSKLTTALITVEQTKNIVVTNIQGRNGPVYEYIGLGPYMVDIKAVIVSPYRDVYPTDAVSSLIDMLEAPVSLRITSNILNQVFNILKVVVMSYRHYQDEGMRNVVHFEISCQDENPFEIKNQLNS